jgi:tetratricopeptide (TPR) repeat protein
MILAGRHADAKERARFRTEAEAVAHLEHEGVVRIYEVGENDGLPYLALEYVDGGTLARKLGGTPQPAREAATLVRAVALAVEAAHHRGIVHRDLKPANVLLACREGERRGVSPPVQGAPDRLPDAAPLAHFIPKITDFGLAKRLDAAGHTETGATLGTPAYMAPEQALARSREVGPAADIYALGAILYEMLTGRPPFRGASDIETLEQVRSQEPVPPRRLQPRLPRDLETVCLKCLQKEPRQRYPSAAALAADLERWLSGKPVHSRPVGLLGRAWRWCRRKPLVAGLLAALGLAVLGGFAGILDQWRQAETARHEAEASDTQSQRLLNELLPSSPGAPQKMRYSQRLPSIDALRQAEAHFERLLGKKPGDTRVRIALTNVRGTLGNLYAMRGQMAEMDACFGDARDLWQALARQAPRNPEYRDWLAATCYWQSLAAANQVQHERRVRLVQQANALWQELAEEQPGNMVLLQKVADTRWELLTLRDPGPGWKEILPPLEEERALLNKRVGADPANTALRKRLALTCLVLGEFRLGKGGPRAALPCWRQAYGHYRTLARARPDDPLVKLNLGLCCSRLMGGQSADPYYAEAVALFGQAGKRLAALAKQHPDGDWLRPALLEAHCSLAVCHWKVGRTAQAEHTFRDKVRPLAALVNQHPADQKQTFTVLYALLRAAGALRDAKHPAVLALAREAAALAEQHADTPSRDPEDCESLANYSLGIAVLLCQLGDPAESLRQAEQGRRLFAGLRRAVPALPRYGAGLSAAWERIAKARWALGQRDEALAAFRESAAVQRQVVAQAPSVRAYRQQLSRCYDKLAHWSGLHGDRAGAAAALLEREKLWPGDAEQLLEVSRDFQELAEAVSKGRKKLSPQEQAERQRYLDHSARAKRAAESTSHKGAKTQRRETGKKAGKK